jgi:hypothetical protein
LYTRETRTPSTATCGRAWAVGWWWWVLAIWCRPMCPSGGSTISPTPEEKWWRREVEPHVYLLLPWPPPPPPPLAHSAGPIMVRTNMFYCGDSAREWIDACFRGRAGSYFKCALLYNWQTQPRQAPPPLKEAAAVGPVTAPAPPPPPPPPARRPPLAGARWDEAPMSLPGVAAFTPPAAAGERGGGGRRNPGRLADAASFDRKVAGRG